VAHKNELILILTCEPLKITPILPLLSVKRQNSLVKLNEVLKIRDPLPHCTSGQFEMIRKISSGFRGCHENALIYSFKMSPSLIV